MNKSKIVSLIEDKLKQLKGTFSSKDVAQEIIDENQNIGMPLQALASMVYKMHSAVQDPTVPEDKVEFDATDKCKYDVKNGKFIWESKRAGKISIKVSEIDEIFWEYSRFGLNMSQLEVRRKHDLTIAQFNSIKSTLDLYKESNIYSDYTLEHTDPSDREQMIAEKMAGKVKNTSEIVKGEVYKEKLKAMSRIIKQDEYRKYHQDEFMEELSILMPTVEKVEVKVSPKKSCKTKELLVSIADLHIGARCEGLKITRDYNPEILKERLRKVASDVNEKQAEEVTVVILGDLIESFTGLNHMDSWKNMEKDFYGAKLVFEAYNMLSEFFEQINNIKSIKIVGGNHDRGSSNKKEDNNPTIAAIIAYMLKEKYSGAFDVEFDNLVLASDFGDKMRVIISHGDNKIIKDARKKDLLDENIMQFGSMDKFNLILTGHWHSRRINQDKSFMRHYSTPSIFSGNDYSERNGWNAEPGFLMVTEDKKTGRPVVMDCPL